MPASPDPVRARAVAARRPADDLAGQAQAGLCVVQDERLRYANAALAEMLGWTTEGLVGQSIDALIAPGYRAHTRAAFARRLAGKPGRHGQIQCLRRDGSLFDARALARRVDHDGRAAVLLTVIDISELTAALAQTRWSSEMLRRTELLCRTGSFELGWPEGVLTASAGLRALVGLGDAATEAARLDALDWVPEEERRYVAGIWRSAAPEQPFEFQHRIVCADGRRLVVLHRGMLTRSGAAGLRGIGLVQDITAQREAESRIQALANQDEVTGLPNRASLLDHTDAALHAARWAGRAVALLAIEVPRIAEAKGRMGFGAGDALAMAVAARLREGCGDREVVARLGDAEFALLLETPTDTPAAALRQRARAVQAALQVPVRLGASEVYPAAAIGIALWPRDADGSAALLEAAQTARLDIAGGAGVSLFVPEITQRAQRAMRVEAALRQALLRGEFTLEFEPQIDLADGRVCAAEVLLRWHSAELGLVQPREFVPLAERAGLIGALGDWALRRACAQLVAWRAAGLPVVRLSVNLSPMQLQRPDLARHLRDILETAGVAPGLLGIELTERTLPRDIGQVVEVLRAVRALGVEVTLDDFGTGSSSLNILSRLPIDAVKVHRSLVHDVTAPPEQVSVTRAIIHMARGLQLKVTAAGVLSEGQLRLLVAHGCDRFQGSWFSAPLPHAPFATLLRDGRRLPDRFLARRQGARTLLLVDDEENIVAALKRLLRRDGYQIITAHNAADGLLRLAEQHVDVILSDQRMPGMTGVEFLRRAKAQYPDTVRMVLSGYTELQSIIDAVNEGAIYRFLTKPWDDQHLREHVAEAFRQKSLADENRQLNRQVASANDELERLNLRLAGLLARQREQAALLGASADGARGLLEDLPAAVLGVDPDGLVAYANRAAQQQLGHGGLVGRQLPEVLPLPAGPAPQRPLRITVAGRRFQVELGALQSITGARGRLLVLTPVESEEPAPSCMAN